MKYNTCQPWISYPVKILFKHEIKTLPDKHVVTSKPKKMLNEIFEAEIKLFQIETKNE